MATEKEREEERSVTHTHRPVTEKREEERNGQNTWYSGRISLCIQLERDAERGFWPDPARNPEDFAKSGQKPRRPRQIRPETHAHRRGFNRSDTLSRRPDPAVPSRPRCPCESTNPKRKDPFDPKQIQKSMNSILLH
jgi:hypothetical protein